MGSEPSFTVRVERRNDVVQVVVVGELDLATVPTLNDHLTSAERDGMRAIALDLREMTFIDSTGLNALLRAKQRAETDGHRLVILGVGPGPRRVFEMTGTESLLDDGEATNVLGRFTNGLTRATRRTPPSTRGPA